MLNIRADDSGYRLNGERPQAGKPETARPEDPHLECNRLDQQTPQQRSAIIHRLIVSFTRAA